jgi:regulator of protease activity HflC (stomatin/prohibitin superfamily)
MTQFGFSWGIAVAAAVVLGYLISCVRIIQEYERGVLFLLGRYVGLRLPGLRFVFRPIQRLVVVDLRLIAEDVPPQDVITLDNVSARVSAVIYFRVVDPDRAILQVMNFRYATSQLSQTSLRSLVGAHVLDDLLAERDKLNQQLQKMLDEQTDPWGIKVASVEIKQVDLPDDMRRAMARQAEAERERRAKVIAAEGEFQASQKVADAAEVLARQPGTLQLRYLQTLVEVASTNSKIVVFPMPLEFMKSFVSDQSRR